MPAPVQLLRSATVHAPSAIAAHSAPLVTLLQEQICASAGSAPTPIAGPPPEPAGAIRATGSPGSLRADQRPQHAVAGRVADQDAAEQGLRVVGEHQLGVGAADRVGHHDLQRARRGGQRVAEAGDVDAEQLEFGGQVGARELRVAAEQPVGDHFGGRVAGPDQAVAAALDRGDLADRIDSGIAGSTGSSRRPRRRARRCRGRPPGPARHAGEPRPRTPAAPRRSPRRC